MICRRERTGRQGASDSGASSKILSPPKTSVTAIPGIRPGRTDLYDSAATVKKRGMTVQDKVAPERWKEHTQSFFGSRG